MKFSILFLVLMTTGFMGCQRKAPVIKTPTEPEVLVEIAPINPLSLDQIESLYTIADGSCRIAWQTISTKKDQQIEVQLKNRTECDKPFTEAVNYHNKVIHRILQDYPPAAITNIVTSGLKNLQPDSSWNKIIADATRTSKEYQNYRRNYPKHSSKSSVNQIFVDLVRQTQPHAPFKQLLKTNGLNFELHSVEKVLNIKAANGETVINDAGALWWKPIQ